VDIFDHVTSMAWASRSRVSKNYRGHIISVSRRLPASAFRPLRQWHCCEINSARLWSECRPTLNTVTWVFTSVP